MSRLALPRALATLPLAAALALTGCQRGASDDPAHDPADSMAAAHADDSTAASPVVQPPRTPVAGGPLVYGPATGYLSVPRDTTGPKVGLIVVHEWWGLNDNVRAMADRFAGEGYRSLAVDLYGGRVATEPDSAMTLVGRITNDIPAVQANLRAAYRALREAGAERVGIIGWCAGGFAALQGALALPSDLDAAVVYYGDVSGATADALRELQMPLLGIFGGQDGSIPVTTVQGFEQRLREADVEAQIKVYPDAAHAFANPSGGNYNAAAAEDAWTTTLAFLGGALRPNTPD